MNLHSERQPCRIVAVGKARTGFNRYWCLEHKANATGHKGLQLESCSALETEYVSPDDTLLLRTSEYKGGVALWGTAPPVYDTTNLKLDRGIHVHARHVVQGPKVIDRTYRAVTIKIHTDLVTERNITISEMDAIYFMVSTLLQKEMKTVLCKYCGSEHLDKDWFAVNKHKRHLCATCGKHFFDDTHGIGNPIISIQRSFENTLGKRHITCAHRSINIRQAEYPGGLRIWAANPALLWLSEASEEDGIHVHAYADDSYKPVVDETFSDVVVDGVKLESAEIKCAMAQNCLPHLADCLTYLLCPRCQRPHFDQETKSTTPHIEHMCESCGSLFQAHTRRKKTICNPFFQKAAILSKTAVNTLRAERLALRPEML